MEQKIMIPVGDNYTAVLSIETFDGDISEEVVKIDYSNLLGEILTFPVVYNRIANLRAQLTNLVAEAKLTFDIFEAKLYEKTSDRLFAENGKKPSLKDIEMAMYRDPSYALNKRIYMRRQLDWEYIDALYWSAQSKDKKLNVLSERITPEEFEKGLLEGSINGVMIKMAKNLIPGVKGRRK